MADIRLAAAVTGLGPGTDPAMDDPDPDVPETERADAALARDRGTPDGTLVFPLVGGEDSDENDQPRDWKGEPD